GYGHEVRVASSGQASLDQAALCRPDVVLLDSALAGSREFHIAHELRAQAGVRPLKLVATTGHSKMEADLERSGAQVFDEHLPKPINPERLRDLLLRLARSPAAAAADPSEN